MEDIFATDNSGFTADGYRRLVPSSKKSMYLSNGIVLIILTVAVVLVFVFGIPSMESDKVLSSIATMALYLICAIYLLVAPIIFYNRYRYRIDSDKAEIRKGVLWISHEMIPVERIHQVDVVRGPINRMFGLADVIITTAGGVAKIQFLEEDVAEEIVNNLNDTVVALLKDRV